MIRHLFRPGIADVNMRTCEFARGLLLNVVYKCRISTRPDAVKSLLENGADLDGGMLPRPRC